MYNIHNLVQGRNLQLDNLKGNIIKFTQSRLFSQFGSGFKGKEKKQFWQFYKKINICISKYSPEIQAKGAKKRILWSLKYIDNLSFSNDFGIECFDKKTVLEKFGILLNIKFLTKENLLILLGKLSNLNNNCFKKYEELIQIVNDFYQDDIKFKLNIVKHIYKIYGFNLYEIDLMIFDLVKDHSQSINLNNMIDIWKLLNGDVGYNNGYLQLILMLNNLEDFSLESLETYLLFELFDRYKSVNYKMENMLENQNRNEIISFVKIINEQIENYIPEFELEFAEGVSVNKKEFLWYLKNSIIPISQKKMIINNIKEYNQEQLIDLLNVFRNQLLKYFDLFLSGKILKKHLNEDIKKALDEWNRRILLSGIVLQK